jgi:hypothetical protein
LVKELETNVSLHLEEKNDAFEVKGFQPPLNYRKSKREER